MNASSLLSARLNNQNLSSPAQNSVKALVHHMGAMQAQDFTMSKWAIGIRTGVRPNDIDNAINRGDILRMHLLRPTWHWVTVEDAGWLLTLTAPSIKALLKTREKQLELTELLYKKTNAIIEKKLSEKHCTGKELTEEIEKRKIDISENRSGHFLMRAELDGIMCSGELRNGIFTYALQSERILKSKSVDRVETIQKLATRYFESHGPAKLSDFVWWSGLRSKEASEAAHNLNASFVKEDYKGETYWLKSDSVAAGRKASAFLLPAYDEFTISYKDRSEMIGKEISKHVISANGIFFPVIVVNGKVVAKWSRKIVKDSVQIHINLFHPVSMQATKLIRKAVIRYAEFIGKVPVIIQPI